MDAETINRIQSQLDEAGKETTEEICKLLYGGSKMVTVAEVLETLGFYVPHTSHRTLDNELYAIHNSGWVFDDEDNIVKFISAE